MTKNEIMTLVAAILTTLEEVGTDSAESTIYMALGMDLQKYEQIRGLLLTSKLVTVKCHRIALTAAGKETAQKCNAVLAENKAKQTAAK